MTEERLTDEKKHPPLTVSSGTRTATLLGITFVVLKLTGVIHWSWWWVLAPWWLVPAVLLGLATVIALIYLLVAAIVLIVRYARRRYYYD